MWHHNLGTLGISCRDMLAELQTQLKEKQADIELAASVGQALLEEIDFVLKDILNIVEKETEFLFLWKIK